MASTSKGSGGTPPPGFVPTRVLSTFAEHQIPEIEACLKVNLRRANLNFLRMRPEHDGTFVIVGGGPSLKDTWPRIKALKENGAMVLGMNDAPLFLNEKGIRADGCVVWETHEVLNNCDIAYNPLDITYYIASRAHPDWYCLFQGHPIVTWHCMTMPGENEIIEEFDDEPVYIAGGCAAGLRSIEIGRALGYRKFHIFGMDCARNETSHAYYDRDTEKAEFEAWVGGESYSTTHYWAQSSIDFVNQCRVYEEKGQFVQICVHGTGLLPAMARENGILVIS